MYLLEYFSRHVSVYCAVMSLMIKYRYTVKKDVKMKTIIKRVMPQKTAFLAGLFGLLMVAGMTIGFAPKVLAACDKVNIVYCGINGSTTNDKILSMRGFWKGNKDTRGNTDIAWMFNWGGFSTTVMNTMTTSNTKVGTLYRDGRIVVDGRVVGTDTWITARFSSGAGFVKVKDGVWMRKTTTSMRNSADQVLVHFDSSGKAIAAIVLHCGNVTRFTPTTPPPAPTPAPTPTPKPTPTPTPVITPATYKCESLKAVAINEAKYQYRFTATPVADKATFQSATFDFGDGTKAEGVKSTDRGKTVSVEKTYTKAGTYKITATLTFLADGKTVNSNCTATITTVKPFYECVELKGPKPDGLTYTFEAVAKYYNGAVLKSADFVFGDGKSVLGVKPTSDSDTSIITQHTYAQPGNYSVHATLKFIVDGQEVTANNCNAKISPEQPPVPECRPGIPVGDPRCEPCPYDASLPKDDPRCQEAPVELPNTGAGNVVAMGLAVVVAGFLFYRHRMFGKHKQHALQAEMGTSPLPLGDPLTTGDPLDGTPHDLTPNEPTHRSNFRRRRQF